MPHGIFWGVVEIALFAAIGAVFYGFGVPSYCVIAFILAEQVVRRLAA